jgi:hypothetical protein
MTGERARFWASGMSTYADQLAQEEKTRLAPLQAELKATVDDDRRMQLKLQLAEIKADVRKRQREARRSLFGRLNG